MVHFPYERKVFSGQPPTPDKLHWEIVAVAGENIQELGKIRREVDGEEHTPLEKELKRYAEGGNLSAFLIREGEKVIGYVEVDLEEDYIPTGVDRELYKELQEYAHIARIGLLTEYLENKIANKLLKHAETWATTHGAPAIWLDYLPGNEPLVRFYEGAGYKEFTTFKDGSRERMRRIVVRRL